MLRDRVRHPLLRLLPAWDNSRVIYSAAPRRRKLSGPPAIRLYGPSYFTVKLLSTAAALLMLLPTFFASGCSKPDRVTTIQSPQPGVFYTVETFKGHGAIDNDYTRVYAHLERNGVSDRQLVISGVYLEFSNITWADSHNVIFCLKAGFTDSYHNEVTLAAGKSWERVHNHLEDQCDAMPAGQ